MGILAPFGAFASWNVNFFRVKMTPMNRVKRLTRGTSVWLVLVTMGLLSLPAVASCCPMAPESSGITPSKSASISLDGLCGLPCCGHQAFANRQLPPLMISSAQQNLAITAAPQAFLDASARVSEMTRPSRPEFVWNVPSLVVLHAQFLI